MKFGQLIEPIMRKIFLKKSYIKCGGETIPRPFSKPSKSSISLDQQSKGLYSFFILYAKMRAKHLLLSHIELFKTKKRSGTSAAAFFSS